MVLRVDADTNHGAKNPVIREGLGPHRIDLEPRRLDRLARRSLKYGLPDTQSSDGRHESAAKNQFATLHRELLEARGCGGEVRCGAKEQRSEERRVGKEW